MLHALHSRLSSLSRVRCGPAFLSRFGTCAAEAGGETKIISADLTQADALTKIEKGIAGLDVGILVNNAGLSYEVGRPSVAHPLMHPIMYPSPTCLHLPVLLRSARTCEY